MADAAVLHRYMGQHRLGAGYDGGDVVAAGRNTYVCVLAHVSGERSIPGIGADWGAHWQLTAGVMLGTTANPDAAAAAQPQSPVTVPFVPRTPRPTPVSRIVRASTPAAPLPSEPPAASAILDDSDDGLPSVALSLDALRQQLKHAARQEWVEGEFRKIHDLLRRALDRDTPADDPLQAEVWRRKGQLLGATGRAEAQAMETAALRQCLQLLRKRDRGGSFTAAEAMQAAHLDNILASLAHLDAVAEDLRLRPPREIGDDLHWRQS